MHLQGCGARFTPGCSAGRSRENGSGKGSASPAHLDALHPALRPKQPPDPWGSASDKLPTAPHERLCSSSRDQNPAAKPSLLRTPTLTTSTAGAAPSQPFEEPAEGKHRQGREGALPKHQNQPGFGDTREDRSGRARLPLCWPRLCHGTEGAAQLLGQGQRGFLGAVMLKIQGLASGTQRSPPGIYFVLLVLPRGDISRDLNDSANLICQNE